MFIYTSPTYVWHKPSVSPLYKYNEKNHIGKRSTLLTSKGIDFLISRCYSKKKVESSTQPSPYIHYHPYFYTHYPTHPNTYHFINDVENTSNNKESEASVKYDVSEDYTSCKYVVNHTNSPLFQSATYTIKVPSKVEYALRRHMPKTLLKEIHPDIDVAIELCLLFTSQLSRTYFTWKDGSNPDGWKALKAAYLRRLFAYEANTYKKIREVLETPLMNGAIIECDYEEKIGAKCFYHRLTDNYIGKGITSYELKTKLARKLRLEYHQQRLKESSNNPICINLFQLYAKITLPTIEEIKSEAKKLIKLGYVSKKGKQLTSLNKHKKEYYSNATDRTFVEDGLEIFDYLTSGGLILPKITKEFAGGRIVDSFVLMPSYIRNMCKIEGQPIVEVDFACLHPNIAIALYGGKQEFISHKMISDQLSIPITQVKKEHLSFFNKHPKEMQKSPLYNYYMETEPVMMKNLIREKYANSRRYKITSQKMFEMEVEIVTDVVRQLSSEGICVGYVYDALFCTPEHAQRVKQVMDEQVKKHGVMTNAKISSPHV
jgi:hypothetical protein